MHKSIFSVYGQFLGIGNAAGEDCAPEVIAQGLTYSEAFDLAESKFFEYCRQFVSQFSVTMTADDWKATREIDGYSWGYRVYLESEAGAEKLQALSEAFGTLREVMELEGINPDSERFLLSDIESDLTRIISGQIRIENSEVLVS